MSFTIAIIGRPNVGKSTLFNRLVGRKLALVDDQPGVTRDRRMADGSIGALKFKIIDTAGLEEAHEDSLLGRMREQSERAIDEADVVLFVIDAKTGIVPSDQTFANMLRRHDRPVILVANKLEGKSGEAGYYDAFSLGFGEPVGISAEHGLGILDLYQALVETIGEERAFPEEFQTQQDMPEGEDEEEFDETRPYDDEKPLRIAIMGRPNAGKSTLINQMIGEERMLTGPEAGITRDSISVDWEWQGRTIRLFDTAGMRKKAKVQEKLEKLSVSDGLRAMQFAEVVIILLDATIPFEKQDLQISDLVIREGRAPVVAINKWDLIDNRQEVLKEMQEKAEEALHQIKGLKVVPVSGKTGEGINKLMRAVVEVHRLWNTRIPTSKLNRWLEGVVFHHPPPAVSGRRIKLKYISQIKTRPPTFAISCSRPEALPTHYIRYLTNAIRADFALMATPIRVVTRKGENPFANRAGKR